MMPLIKRFEHLQIQLEAIKSATENFGDDTRIGKGGFGNVYKGELTHSRGRTMVAIKRLNRAFGQGDPEFWKEIIMLSLYRHENLVSLLGFCDESGEKILVYEYASRRSLDLYLNSNDLSWVRRLEVCIGAARGLAYLHSSVGTQQRVLHRDIKSSNILLDENWNARISDFGLSKFGPANQQYTFLVSNTVGTIGYCDPLYVETGLLTKESDVYSFGVVLFEVLCGRLCITNDHDKRRPLTALVRQFYKENKIIEIVYNNIKDEINPNSLKAFTTIAHRCLSRDREARPSMTEVLSALESALEYQSGSTPSLIKAEVPWSARRGSFSEKDRVLKTVRGILNKLTPEKFDVLERQLLLSSGIRTTDIFKGVISLIFDKAILEPIFCPVYARLCSNLSMKLPPFPSDEPGGKDITFKQMLLNNCQDVFEGAKMREEIRQMASIEQESERRDKERIVKLLKLGNIIFISELKKWRVVPKKIVHHIIQELLGPDLDVKICPAEDNIEAICLVFRTIGKQLDDNQNSRQTNDFYFVLLKELSTNQQLAPRLRFMVLDVIDLRSNKWVPRREEVLNLLFLTLATEFWLTVASLLFLGLG